MVNITVSGQQATNHHCVWVIYQHCDHNGHCLTSTVVVSGGVRTQEIGSIISILSRDEYDTDREGHTSAWISL